MWLTTLTVVALGLGLGLIIFGPRVDAYQQRRGYDLGSWFRVPARRRGTVVIVVAAVFALTAAYFRR